MKALLKHIVVTILTWEARVVLLRHKPKVVAVTGSVGKTSTKDAVYTVLRSKFFARKSEKSFNSELGVPLTILGLPTAWSSPVAWLENIAEGLMVALFTREYPDWLVLEVGADRPGDIKKLGWVKPDVVVFTHFPDVPVHVEFFESAEQVIAEKRELKKALRLDGTLIVNADDPKMQAETVHDGQHVLRYGFAEDATVRADTQSVVYEDDMPVGVSSMVHFQNESQQVTQRGVLGGHHVYPQLVAIAVAVSEGVSFSDAVQALGEHACPPGRMRVLPGMHRTCLIDDTYNASPAAVAAGLDALAELPDHKRKVVVLGDMLELGDFSVPAHEEVGTRAAQVADIVVFVGIRMRAAALVTKKMRGKKVKRIETCKDSNEAAELLRGIVQEGDIVFVKGSQSMRMERVVAALLADPDTAPRLLVRQEKEWQER
jgi:UDP-N-acetylmuramoyl-tripeptide--D-alanyl-D-alanine ligase